MCKRVYIYITILLSFLSIFFYISISRVEASYAYCDNKIEETEYYDCGGYVYTYPEDIIHSSKIVSLNGKSSIIYLGEKEGISIFYAQGFKFYNVTYDDRSNKNNNIWTVVTSEGKKIFSGAFDDSWMIDDSHQGYYSKKLYSQVYTIKQYTNDGDLYRTMVVYNVDDSLMNINDITYDGLVLNNLGNEVLESNDGIRVSYSSKYGVKDIDAHINDTSVNYQIDDGIYINSDEINKNLVRGESVNLTIEFTDYFGKSITKVYPLSLVNNNVTIKFSTLTSVMESSSRRIVVDAIAGKGKSLDTDYAWYYWSTSPDDSLLYDDFLKNYVASSYKGSYSEDKGVILRNTSGTYYLYALAKDEDSWVVERSEGYTLNDDGYKVDYSVYDAILIVSLLILCVVPIAIYLFISKKGY